MVPQCRLSTEHAASPSHFPLVSHTQWNCLSLSWTRNTQWYWVETKITFHNPETRKTPPEVPRPAPRAIDIRLVSKRTMDRICQEVGSMTFLLSPRGTQ